MYVEHQIRKPSHMGHPVWPCVLRCLPDQGPEEKTTLPDLSQGAHQPRHVSGALSLKTPHTHEDTHMPHTCGWWVVVCGLRYLCSFTI
jgi:hypothetical protein